MCKLSLTALFQRGFWRMDCLRAHMFEWRRGSESSTHGNSQFYQGKPRRRLFSFRSRFLYFHRSILSFLLTLTLSLATHSLPINARRRAGEFCSLFVLVLVLWHFKFFSYRLASCSVVCTYRVSKQIGDTYRSNHAFDLIHHSNIKT